MREILFRGKRKDNGKWVYGFYSDNGAGESWIRNWDTDDNSETFGKMISYDVIPESVGQYIGLTDMDGIKMFEGDVVKTVRGNMVIEYMKDSFQCIDMRGCNHRLFDFVYSGCIKVAGNTFDNPELFRKI